MVWARNVLLKSYDYLSVYQLSTDFNENNSYGISHMNKWKTMHFLLYTKFVCISYDKYSCHSSRSNC